MKLTTGKALLAGCIAMAMSQAAMAKDIKVAVVGAMSGPVAQWGDMEFNGARQAIKDINAKGGIKGDKLVGVEYDDACDPKQAVAVANKIVNDGIQYVIGHLCSSSTQPASDIYEDEGILMITPAATNAGTDPARLSAHYAYRRAGLLSGADRRQIHPRNRSSRSVSPLFMTSSSTAKAWRAPCRTA